MHQPIIGDKIFYIIKLVLQINNFIQECAIVANITERRNKILEILTRNGSVKSSELVEILNTSRETVRRDLNALAKKNLLTKTYGGAIASQKNTWEFIPLKEREKTHLWEKKSLAKYAAQAIKEYDTIFLDNSTTVMNIIDYIPKKFNITFIINSVRLLTHFANLSNNNWKIINLGGTLNYETFSTDRYLTINNLKNFKPNKAFLSCHGIDDELVVTESRLEDVEIKKYIVKNCKESYLLIDYFKLARRGVIRFGNATDFYNIITNNQADGLFISKLNSQGCKIKLVPSINKPSD